MFSLSKKILSRKKPATHDNTKYPQIVLELAHDWEMSADRVHRLMMGEVPQSSNEAGISLELQRRGLI